MASCNSIKLDSHSQKICERHPELHHYTNEKGLKGIISSGQIWATHYEFLNDSTEFQYLRPILETQLERRLCAEFRKLLKSGHFTKQGKDVIRSHGLNAIARQESRNSVKILYKITFGTDQHENPFSPPFIASFCSHSRDHEYEKRNGLLSQWRGYGDEIGYAVVFHTRKLLELVEKEADQFNYSECRPYEVSYDIHSAETADQIESILQHLFSFAMSAIDESYKRDTSALWPGLIRAAASVKHPGFSEEREIRIVACPFLKTINDRVAAAEPSSKKILEPLKAIRSSEHNDQKKFISLFDGQEGAQLPIKRIIVGPSKRQIEAAHSLQHWLSQQLRYSGLKVVKSETPYIDQRGN